MGSRLAVQAGVCLDGADGPRDLRRSIFFCPPERRVLQTPCPGWREPLFFLWLSRECTLC